MVKSVLLDRNRCEMAYQPARPRHDPCVARLIGSSFGGLCQDVAEPAREVATRRDLR